MLRPELDGFVSVDDLSKPDFDVERVYRTVSPALAFQVKILVHGDLVKRFTMVMVTEKLLTS